jgi:hypothetical protein
VNTAERREERARETMEQQPIVDGGEGEEGR